MNRLMTPPSPLLLRRGTKGEVSLLKSLRAARPAKRGGQGGGKRGLTPPTKGGECGRRCPPTNSSPLTHSTTLRVTLSKAEKVMGEVRRGCYNKKKN